MCIVDLKFSFKLSKRVSIVDVIEIVDAIAVTRNNGILLKMSKVAKVRKFSGYFGLVNTQKKI